MGNCLVTKLKSVVPDPEKKFDYFGGAVITLFNSGSGVVNTAKIGNEVMAKFIDGDANFVTSDSDTTVIEDEDGWVVTGRSVYYVASVDTPVRVLIKPYDESTNPESEFSFVSEIDINKVKKYVSNTGYFSLKPASGSEAAYGPTVHFRSYAGCFTNMVSFEIVSDHIDDVDINLAHFDGANSISSLDIRKNGITDRPQVHGDISYLANAAATVRDLNINCVRCSGITGSIEDFAAAFASRMENGRKAILKIRYSSVTYNGSTLSANTVTITVDSSAPNGYTITT